MPHFIFTVDLTDYLDGFMKILKKERTKKEWTQI